MTVPQEIKEGDFIAIVAPAGKINKEQVIPAAEWLGSQDYRIQLGDFVFDQHHQFAGTDQNRITDFQKAIDDSEIAAILCARGGYGTGRIIDNLDFSQFIKCPKWIVGYSDITVLHSHLNNLGIASIHGVMPGHFLRKNGEPSNKLKSLLFVLSGGKPEYTVEPNSKNREGNINGKLVGGNLSILYGLRGTKFDIDFTNKILFIEDVGENLYHIDRMMQNFKQGGVFNKIAGLVVGDFSKMKDSKVPFGKDAYEIISEAVFDYTFPICFGFPAGHAEKNEALVFGVEWQLNVTETSAILKMR